MDILDSFANVKVLIVGDVMLDRYWWGDVGRISPEAPVPVVRLANTTLAAGGAANVAVNVAGLGAKPLLFGIVGSDKEADLVREVLDASGVASEYLVEIVDRPTTVKTRVIAHSQQVARIDHEMDADLDETSELLVTEKLAPLVKMADAIAVYEHLLRAGIIVRNKSGDPGCENCLRISIGTPDENNILLSALKKYKP